MATPVKRRFSTGITFLDRVLDGGIEVESLVALTAPPGSQSELLLDQFVRTRPSLYVSTVRPEAEVREHIARQDAETPDLTVLNPAPDDLLAAPEQVTSQVPPESYVLVDTVDGLESADRGRYLAFLNDLKARLRETDSVGVLHCVAGDSPVPPLRDLSLNRADQVWQLQVLTLSRDIKTRLLIPKVRNGRALTEPIDLLMTDRVRVDTSRRIS